MNDEKQNGDEVKEPAKEIPKALPAAQEEEPANPKEVTHPDDDDKDKPKKKRWGDLELQDRILLILTGGIVLIGGVTAYIFLQQANIMQDQLEEMRGGGQQTERLVILNSGQLKAAANSATAAATQAEAAKKQAQTAADALTENKRAIKATLEQGQKALDASIGASQLDERPWVVPSRFRLSEEPDGTKDINIQVWLVNTGKTPAIDVVPQSQVMHWLAESEPVMPEFGGPDMKTPSRGILTPSIGDNSFKTTPWRFGGAGPGAGPGELAAYNSGLTRLYLRAMVRYSDVSGKPHWTTICVSHGHSQPLDMFDYCQHGNDVDHEKAQQEKKH